MPHRIRDTLARAVLALVFGCFVAGAVSAAERPVNIVALGDSLTAGYGLPAAVAFPAQLEQALRERGHAVTVANAGVSGNTASDGLDRLDWSVPEGTDAVIVALGANDALRGIDPAMTRKALATIVRRLQERKIPVLLAGMLAPRNLGADYVRAFDSIFPELAAESGVLLYPFFLEGVVGDPRLNLPDGIHPNAEGIAVMVRNIVPQVEILLGQVRQASRP
jgi:acyl-CoA thioesterase I